MRKVGKESAAPAEKGADRQKGGNGWFRSHWCALSMCAIIIVAFLLRFVFAYGVSADGDYALSGGSNAQYHLHVVESILNGTYSMTDATVNYPVGGVLYIPPLLDIIAAAVAMLFEGSLGTTAAASLGLGVLAPIFGTLTCIPVYMIGREMYDKKIGVVSALVFAFLALPISTSVFSNGNEYSLAAFLIVFMVYFLLKMAKAADAADATEGGSWRGVLVNGAVAGVFLALAALTWNGFRVILLVLIILMVLQAVVSRLKGKDVKKVANGYALAILIGTLVPAIYYIPAGLFDLVYSGPLLAAIVSVVFVYAFAALQKKPWVITIPALIIVFLVFCVVLAVVAPDVFDVFIFGNSLFTDEVMAELATTYVSMSEVASYYGWFTMWLPLCVVIWETYQYFRKDRSVFRLMVIILMFGFFCCAWTSYSAAVVVGCMFAVGTAASVVLVIRKAHIRDWASSIRKAGFPGCFRKLVKPLPLVSVLVVALLIILPNVSFAVDAGISSNTEDDDAYYAGNTSYTIKTGDSYPIEDIWASTEDQPKSGAIATWIDYSYDAVSQAGFESVTDTLGNGATSVANIYLGDGSSGAIAAMMMRIMMSNTDVDYSSCFPDSSVYETLMSYIEDPELAKDEITNDPDTYGSVRSDLSDDVAVYLAGVECISSGMSLSDIMETYDKVCEAADNSINYILVDGSMLPLYYGDGDIFSTIAYFAGYSIDSYGAASQYYSINYYYGYASYTDEMYETLLWKALIGVSADDAGYSSAYSYLSALTLSDGSEDSAKAVPGSGLAGFTVASWIVYYNPDSEAESDDDGWYYIDGYEALELQATDGGVINYLASIVLLEYTGTSSSSTITGLTTGSTTTSDIAVVDEDGESVDGAEVDVYYYSETFSQYIKYSENSVSTDGVYTVLLPEDYDYYIEISIGDVVLATYQNTVPDSYTVKSVTAEGEIVAGDNVYDSETMILELTGVADEITLKVYDGTFSVTLLPGEYDYVVTGADGTSLGSGTVTLYADESGSVSGLQLSLTTYTITVTVKDVYGNTIDGTEYEDTPIVYATDVDTGAQLWAEVDEDGTAVIDALPGTYTISMGNGMTTILSTTYTVSSSSKTASVTAYESETVEISGLDLPDGIVLTVTAGSFSTVAYVDGDTITFDIPVGYGTDNVVYSVYGLSGTEIYYGVYTGGTSLELQCTDYVVVSGQLHNDEEDDEDTDEDETGEEGTVTFMTSDFDGFQITYVTDGEGNFTAIVPAVSDLYIYATNEDDLVYYAALDASGDVDELEIQLVDGRTVTQYFKFDSSTSGGNENLAFVLVTIEFTYDDVDYVLYSMTNTSGVVYFYIPDNITADVYINGTGTLDNEYFYCSDITRAVSSGTSDTSATEIIRYAEYSSNPENYVKTVTVTNTYDFDFTYVFYDDDDDTEVTVSAGEEITLFPGQYTITVDGSTGYYFDGTVYLYLGETELTGFDYIEVVVVETTSGENDTVTVTASDDDAVYYEDEDEDGVYYLQIGYGYLFTSTAISDDEDDEYTYVIYAYVDLTEAEFGDDAISIDITAVESLMDVTGYIGVEVDGTITVEYTNSNGDYVLLEFDIDEGAYTISIPESTDTIDVTAEVSSTDDDDVEHWFSGSATFTGLSDGAVRNLSVSNSDAPEEEEDEEDDDDDDDEPTVELEIDDADFTSGVASVTFTVTNLTDVTMTYLVTAGDSWMLDEATAVTVEADSSATFTVTGTYDPNTVAPGLDGVTLTVEDVNGEESVTKSITMNSSEEDDGEDLVVYIAGEDDAASYDKISGSQYMYAITFVNNSTSTKTAVITIETEVDGWYVTVMDSDGYYVGSSGDEITIYGLQTVTYYVSLLIAELEPDESVDEVPSVDVTISGDASYDISFVAETIDVETSDGTVSGDNAMDERSDVPYGIWFMLAVIILLVIAVLWLASKRGVFSRS